MISIKRSFIYKKVSQNRSMAIVILLYIHILHIINGLPTYN